MAKRWALVLSVIPDRRSHVLAATGTVLLCAAMYALPQYWQPRAAMLLPLTALDRSIPFWPASGLVYFAVFPFLLASFLLLPDRERATRFLYASLLAQLIGMACFLLWPTTYPRELFDVPPDTGALGRALAGFVRAVDAPVNCLPSLHVSTVAICVASQYGSRWFRPALLAGIVLALSTLTFKQHYVADALAGLALGLGSWWTCFRWPRLWVLARP
jgi:hypothetical protein